MTKRNILLGFSLFCSVFFSVQVPSYAAGRVQPTDETVVIVIDPGHGGENLGTIENGFTEKTMTMVTAQAMYDELCLYDDVKVYMTHTEDVDLSLKARAEFAAALNADFLFSIHYNASVRHDLFGSEVWIPSSAPYNAYGYQVGYKYLEEMRDIGISLRGIKTRLLDNQKADYYGIIRESVALSVPAVILEHCHVDEERDYPYCDTNEELIAFGKADATAVAKYFGLKSAALGIDYSTNNDLPLAERDQIVQTTVIDETSPDICMIEITDTDESTGTIVLNVTAADYDSPLIYYDYSYDGGITYSPLQLWPDSDPLTGNYKDTIQVTITVPSNTQPDIIFRAHNMYDLVTESNRISLLRTFLYHDDSSAEEIVSSKPKEEAATDQFQKLPGTTTFRPVVSEEIKEVDEEVSFFDFLQICLVMVTALFMILLFSRFIVAYRRRKRRRQRRKESGNNRNHPQ